MNTRCPSSSTKIGTTAIGFFFFNRVKINTTNKVSLEGTNFESTGGIDIYGAKGVDFKQNELRYERI
jgi:hypothetical protein